MRYKDLVVWQKAHSLALKAISVIKEVKPSHTNDIFTRQLLRAVTSIGANIAEGYSRYEGKEFGRFLRIAYGSAIETDNWLQLLSDAKIVPPEPHWN